MIKISNITYYKNHLKNLERYTISGKSLHVVGKNSSMKSNINKTVFLDSNISLLGQLNDHEKFDNIIFSEYFETNNNLFNLFQDVKKIIQPSGKLIISVVNYRYSWLIKILEFVGLKAASPKLAQINQKNIKNLAETTGFSFISSHTKQILPFHFFGIFSKTNSLFELLFNRFNLGINKYLIFKAIDNVPINRRTRCVIIPAKNEEGNIPILFEKIKNIELDEIIFSIGNSKDNTLEVTKKLANENPKLNIIIHQQTKNGKANAIWESFKYIQSDYIAILDSDLSVDPYELNNFYSILDNNFSDFVNGTRLIYPMEKNSMRFINLLGNRVFQAIISFIIGYNLSDSLCGTKVFKRDFISKINWWQNTYKLRDPFCDFDLLFAASITGQKIVEYPVHYKSRIYGKTQISRFKDGFKLIIYLIKSYKVFHTS